MSKCDNCRLRKESAKAFDIHWHGEDDCPYEKCPMPDMSVCERCTENHNCAWQNHEETICKEKPAFPQTNYDRLISKTPEELAKWLARVAGCRDGLTRENAIKLCTKTIHCNDCWLEWLRQEVQT